MQKLIKNNWRHQPGEPFATAKILQCDVHPEGLDVDRIRFLDSGHLALKSTVGHIISVLRGNGTLFLNGDDTQSYCLAPGVHFYIPSGLEIAVSAKQGTEFVRVSSTTAAQARGRHFLLRDETFLAICASSSNSLRWILTPQYLSRRIFLHHDPILVSKSGRPVSWFRTTMFDVTGLPKNADGESVFKMSYNSRTEFNVCYDVKGTARVRMARHPYQQERQLWDPWLKLDSDSTYHLNEAAGSAEEEFISDAITGTLHPQRNKHEVYIVDGYVSLFCLFDPAPTGIERHRPGDYSDYESLSQIPKTELETYRQELARYDEMIDRLSIAKARGELETLHETPLWSLYLEGRKAQATMETDLIKSLAAKKDGRERIVAQWTHSAIDEEAQDAIYLAHSIS